MRVKHLMPYCEQANVVLCSWRRINTLNQIHTDSKNIICIIEGILKQDETGENYILIVRK